MIDKHSRNIQSWDGRRDIYIGGSKEKTIQFCVDNFLEIAHLAILKKNKFTVALSGGSTPKAIFKKLSSEPYSSKLNWSKVWLFWSDERSVGPTDPDSNYHMAMESGFKELPISKEQVFRMEGEIDIALGAREYEKLIKKHVGEQPYFDLVMLGMGDDGHTASLFPNTEALHVHDKLVAANHVPQKDTWRMTLTYECINHSSHINIYVIGEKKAEMLQRVLAPPNNVPTLPSENLGSKSHKALWIADDEAAKLL